MKRTIALVLAIMLTLAMIPAMAATQAKIVKETLYSGTGEYYIKIDNWTYDEEIVSITSSNSSVIKVTDQSRYVTVKKAGQAKIKIKYKLNGKTRTISATFTVKEYPKPVKSLTVNGKKVALKKESRVQYRFDRPDLERKASIKINLKPASGWKISRIKAYYYNVGNTSKHYSLTVKNNKTFKIKKRCEAVVTYTLKNKKGVKFNYVVEIKTPGE